MKLVLFDLDGTLCDTLADITASLNRALAVCGFPAFTPEQASAMIGRSTAYLCQRAMPRGHENDWETVRDHFLADYLRHLSDKTVPYDGIPEAVAALRAAGYTLAVVTNKPHAHAVALISRVFDGHGACFAQVQGHSPKFLTKPDPESLAFVIASLGATPADAVYVGDSDVDLRFAENMGVPFIGCAWGFRGRDALLAAGANVVVDRPAELPAAVAAVLS